MNIPSTQNYAAWLRQATPYINSHRNKTFVLMLPGDAVCHANFTTIVQDIALLNSLGVRIVLIHGARPQIEARLTEAGVSSQLHKQLRITPTEQMPYISQAIGEVRLNIEAALSTGLPNSPMHGAHLGVISGNFVTAMPHGVIDGVDLQHTGKVRRIDTQALQDCLATGAVALLSPLGYSLTGESFNLSLAELATRVAIALKADKLIAFAEVDGIVDQQGTLLHELTLSETEQQLQLSQPHNTQLALQACFQACSQGVTRAQLINYSRDGSLLTELFSRDGSGTMIHSDSYEQLRAANIDDVGGILELLAPLEQNGVLVRRSRERLETEIDRFCVCEKDGTVIACAALYPFADQSAELAAVSTHPDYRKQGLATRLLHKLEQTAKQQHIQRLFALTTQTAHWFIEQGFSPATPDELPAERQDLYNLQRNSKVFSKQLA